MSHRPASRRFRLLKAYGVTLQVLASYLLLWLVAFVRGPDWAAGRRPAYHRRNARRVVHLILDLKGLFIKVGQLISILTNFLPEDFRRELEQLQDRIPPRPLEEIERRIREEFGVGTADLFTSFTPEPLASASLAQVHEARLHDGRRVAVKVQHADIEAMARMDLRTIRRIVGLVGVFVRVRGLQAQYRQVETMIHEELDFAQEARHIEAIAANFEDDPGVFFPCVVPERSTRRVLTTEYIDGTKVSNLEALDARGIDRPALAEQIVQAYCRMIFRDGLYHADPHPGNILVRPDGGVAFIDFGAVARLSPEMREGIAAFLVGILRRDADGIAGALRQMGFVPLDVRDDPVTELIDEVHAGLFEHLDLAGFRLQDLNADAMMQAKLDALADFRKLGISFRDLTSRFQVPKDWILLQRTVLLLTGLCTLLDPAMNPMRTIQGYLERFVLGPEKDWRALVGGVVKETALAALAIPDEMRRLLGRANRGDVEVQVRGLRESVTLLYALGHQLLYGFFVLGAGTLAYLAHTDGNAGLASLLVAGAGFFALCLAGSMLRARKLQRRHR